MGKGVPLCMDYMHVGMCGLKGTGFSAALVRDSVSNVWSGHNKGREIHMHVLVVNKVRAY